MKKEELEEKVEIIEKELNKNKRKNKILIIIIILLIIILLIMCLLGYKMGKIGYSTVNSSGTTINDNIDLIEITDENGATWKNNNLQIFKNEKFNGEKIIAPNSKGAYQFYVKNGVGDNITYNINVLDEMSHFINMKYKLKLNDVYICGNKDQYVGIDKLNIDNIVLMKDSTTLYTLEWYWEDEDELDTFVGSLEGDQYYTLKLNIQASKLSNN